ncbi:MAG: hypothetical protein WBF75_08425 [Pseudonocardiaceae bacterium]
MSSTARDGVQACMPANVGEAASLVESAMLLRWRAPELALLLADRAVTAGQDDKMAVLRAGHLAVFALNRLGRHGEAANRLFPAIRDADTPPGLRHELNVELAHCSAALSEPATALGAVCAVLAAGDDVAPVLRGRALVVVAEASAGLGCDDLVTSALEEADELYREDPSLDHDTALLLRAAARAADAVRHRRRDAVAESEAKAREGRELLTGLADPEHDSGEVSARLMLEIVLALLDRDAGDIALQEVRPLLRRPVRAAAAGAVGRLRLALATRVHLAQGRHESALTLLADAVEGAQRYGVDAVLAECLEGLSHVHEARGEFADALHCMRAARAAEDRHRRHVEAVRSMLLENCGTARREEARLVSQVTVLLGNVGTGCSALDSDTGPLSAVITPGTATHQTAQLEAAQPEAAQPELIDPSAAVEPVVEGPDPVSQQLQETPETLDAQSAESSNVPDSGQSGARHHRGVGTLVFVSDLLPASALSSGRSGRRRAAEPAEDRADETPVAEEHEISVSSEDTQDVPLTWEELPVAGPPPAPAPRELEWEPVDEDSAREEEPHQMGLGDLLAEALSAYHESRDIHVDAHSTEMPGNDDATAAYAETSCDVPRYRVLGTRWAAGLALAPKPTGADKDDPLEAMTNPLLRLPDLTAEPRWAPPETGRRSAVGD